MVGMGSTITLFDPGLSNIGAVPSVLTNRRRCLSERLPFAYRMDAVSMPFDGLEVSESIGHGLGSAGPGTRWCGRFLLGSNLHHTFDPVTSDQPLPTLIHRPNGSHPRHEAGRGQKRFG